MQKRGAMSGAKVPLVVAAMALGYVAIAKWRFEQFDQDKGEHRRHTIPSVAKRIDRQAVEQMLGGDTSSSHAPRPSGAGGHVS